MKLKYCFSFLLLLVLSISAHCQDSTFEYFITVNSNLYLPINNPNKGVYPILGYDKTTHPKLLIGGFGVGFTAIKSIKNKASLKLESNFSRYTYWDEPVIFIGGNNQPAGQLFVRSSDYTSALLALVQYSFTKHISLGTGIGTHALLFSRSKLKVDGNKNSSLSYLNRNYKSIVPVIPLELSLKSKNAMFNVRYEYALLNRLRGDLAQEKKDKYSVLIFEIGLRIK